MSISVTKTVDSRSIALFNNFVHFVYEYDFMYIYKRRRKYLVRLSVCVCVCLPRLGVCESLIKLLISVLLCCLYRSIAGVCNAFRFVEYCLQYYWQAIGQPEIRHCYMCALYYCKNIEIFSLPSQGSIHRNGKGDRYERVEVIHIRLYKSYLTAYIKECVQLKLTGWASAAPSPYYSHFPAGCCCERIPSSSISSLRYVFSSFVKLEFYSKAVAMIFFFSSRKREKPRETQQQWLQKGGGRVETGARNPSHIIKNMSLTIK